ncbi:protein REVEILLE 8-like isoform X3 [Camellia sinensis]|uniref:protein REVEILLE 8-like isoform X3 n=1 Tax=Camellia sinensis TaxID=4442 RepID=UPI00103641C8|nr:protein REVEILLE 8-like isoform X3 [Camellia sinensis]
MAYPTSLNSLAPGYSPWDDTSMLIHSPSGGIMLSQDEYNLHGVEADIGSKGVARISNSGIDGIRSLSRTISSSELSKQGKPGSLFHGIPDFAKVYSFMGIVFDPDTQGHVQKLKEMDPINFEIVKKRE